MSDCGNVYPDAIRERGGDDTLKQIRRATLCVKRRILQKLTTRPERSR